MAFGNDQADEAAQEGASFHDTPSEQDEAHNNNLLKLHTQFLMHVSKNLAV